MYYIPENELTITFAPGYNTDTTAKTIRKGMETFLDILVVTEDNKVFLPVHRETYPSSLDPKAFFNTPGKYELTVRVASTNTPVLRFKFTFDWTGDRSTIGGMACHVENI